MNKKIEVNLGTLCHKWYGQDDIKEIDNAYTFTEDFLKEEDFKYLYAVDRLPYVSVKCGDHLINTQISLEEIAHLYK